MARQDVFFGQLAIKAPRVAEGGSLIQQYRKPVRNVPELHPEELAATRVRQFMWDIGKVDRGHVWGWKLYVAEVLDLPYATALAIINGRLTRLGLKLVKHIAARTGCPISVFYDEKVTAASKSGKPAADEPLAMAS
jgi:hypothetical protein